MCQKYILRCTFYFFTLLYHQKCIAECRPNDISNTNLTKSSLYAHSLSTITIDNEAINDSSVLRDNNNYDKEENARESPHTSPQTTYEPYQEIYNDLVSSSNESDESERDSSICILARSEFYLSWWVNEDGSLRIPTFNRLNTSGILDLSLNFSSENALFNHVINFRSENPSDIIVFMSMANNRLKKIPTSTLNLTSTTLQYLSLAGNDFPMVFYSHNTTFQEFSAFPLMNNLKELDLRNCSIIVLQIDYFYNLPYLDKLFLSHNHIIQIETEAFLPLINLRHLDISYNEIIDFDFLLGGLILEEDIFEKLQRLMFLDLSHTRLHNSSIQALKNIKNGMEQLSLCYTEISYLEPNTFYNKSIKVIDLSGNPNLRDKLNSENLKGLENTLEILVFRNASITSLDQFKSLKKMRMLDLRKNLLRTLTSKNFSTFTELEILDVGDNLIHDWSERVFYANRKLRILNLRSNNIHFMREPMLKDFYETRFLSIGANDFVCACNLRDFIDRASRNAKIHYCRAYHPRKSKKSLPDEMNNQNPQAHYDILRRGYSKILYLYENSYQNIIRSFSTSLFHDANERKNNEKALTINGLFTAEDCDNLNSEEWNDNGMNFEFILLDYTENDYKCSKPSKSGEPRRYHFNEIDPCNHLHTTTYPYEGGSGDESNEEVTPTHRPFETTTRGDSDRKFKLPFNVNFFFTFLIVPLFILIIVLYYKKRADIKYFFAIFKNSLILSLDKDDKKSLVLNRKKSNAADNFTYDVFVSYSEKDRSWVLDQLIPNIERRSEINICLHERDFQVGLSILENIIQCMDKSRCLLLVVSESFLKSNWCSFEMHLAQHRLIETRREQLILVLLQDIPRSKRSRTLQFLMRTKTYICWPNDDKEESQSLFWKRLKKAIVLNNWEPEKSSKPRHSIV